MTTEDVKLLRRIWAHACRKLQVHQIESAKDKIFFPQAQITAIWSGIKRLGLLQDLLSNIKGAMSLTAHVRDEALHLENVHQLFQVLRVIQYKEFIVIYLSHPLTVRRVIRPLLLYSPCTVPLCFCFNNSLYSDQRLIWGQLFEGNKMSSHSGCRSGSGHNKIFAKNSAKLQSWRKTRKRILLDGTIFSSWVSARIKCGYDNYFFFDNVFIVRRQVPTGLWLPTPTSVNR